MSLKKLRQECLRAESGEWWAEVPEDIWNRLLDVVEAAQRMVTEYNETEDDLAVDAGDIEEHYVPFLEKTLAALEKETIVNEPQNHARDL